VRRGGERLGRFWYILGRRFFLDRVDLPMTACLVRPWFAATLALLLIAGANCGAAGPNLLLITSEDNGPELGRDGDPYVRTPNLDRLAAEGVRFERAFVATASCSESRAAILTGLYPHQNGQFGLATHHYRMYGDVPNMASLCRSHGYRTGLIGKLHVNPESAFPLDYRPDVEDCNSPTVRDVRRVAQLAEEFFQAGDSPFLLMVNYADAHLPFLRQQHGLPAAPLDGDTVRPLPWIGLDEPRLRASQADYYNCLMRLDEGVGELLTALDRAGATENTLVIYLSDHGAQFPRGKLASFESSLQVPLVLRWPGRIPRGQVRGELVATVDLLPTVLEAAGIQGPARLAGTSLLPLAAGGDGPWRKHLFAEYHAHVPPLYFPQRTVRDDRYKLIVNLLADRPNPVAAAYSHAEQPPYPSYVTPTEVARGAEEVRRAYAAWSDAAPIELYDLQTDPHEWRNRADDPELVNVKARLLGELAAWRAETGDPLVDEGKLAQLTAEHDAVAPHYQRPDSFEWKYPAYLQPADAVQD